MDGVVVRQFPRKPEPSSPLIYGGKFDDPVASVFFYETNGNIPHILPLSDLAQGFADNDHVLWFGKITRQIEQQVFMDQGPAQIVGVKWTVYGKYFGF